jgi:hypothetical protein
MKQRAQFTFEVEETIVLRQPVSISNVFCRQCGSIVGIALPQTVADLSRISEREIFRLVEAGEIHFIEAKRFMICLNSILMFGLPPDDGASRRPKVGS